MDWCEKVARITHLESPICGPNSVEELVAKILISFAEALAIMIPGDSDEVCEDPTTPQAGSPCCDDQRAENSGENSGRPASIDHRWESIRNPRWESIVPDNEMDQGGANAVCGKGKMSETWIQITLKPVEDGYSWRKYNQKETLNARHPRSYFRCTHRHDQGCQATKQIQETEDEIPMYRTTYTGHHTCLVLKPPQSVMENSKRSASIDNPRDREGYKTRKILETWTEMTPDPMEDGYSCRKYGQKEILNAKFPRSYFRCTHSHDQGCLATKQIQKTEDETPMYRTTYIGHHRCHDVLKAPQFVMDAIPKDAFLPSFESNPATKQELPCFSSFPSVKQEPKKEEALSDPKTHNCQLSSKYPFWSDLLSIAPGPTSVLPSTSGSNPATKQELPCFSSFSSVDQSSTSSTSVFPSTSGSDYGDVSGMYSYTSCSHSSFDMGMDSMDWS